MKQSLQDELQNPFPTLDDTLTVLLEHNLLFNLEVRVMLLHGAIFWPYHLGLGEELYR